MHAFTVTVKDKYSVENGGKVNSPPYWADESFQDIAHDTPIVMRIDEHLFFDFTCTDDDAKDLEYLI